MSVRAIRDFKDDFHLGLDLRSPHLPSENLDLEIGCGVGMHPLAYCLKNPNRNLIAIEHTKNKFQSFWKKYEQLESLDNLIPIHANAISWVTQNLKPESLENVFILYPNPYPKKRQANQRWHQMAFMKKLLDCMRFGSSLTLATNMRFYAEEARSYFCDIWGMQEILFETIQRDSHSCFVPRTHFEKKYFERGETLYNMILKKPAQQDSNLRPSD